MMVLWHAWHTECDQLYMPNDAATPLGMGKQTGQLTDRELPSVASITRRAKARPQVAALPHR